MIREYLATDTAFGSGRYEVKLLFEGTLAGQLRGLIQVHSGLFRQAFPPRQVNNIYFDTTDYDLQNAHVHGAYQRFKVRLRWYHDTWSISESALEIKSKQGNLGRKQVFPIKQELDLSQSWQLIQSAISAELPPQYRGSFDCTRPVLINYYQREYYLSASGKIRLTLDTGIRSLDQRFGSKPNLKYFLPMRNVSIIEIKAVGQDHLEISQILDEFPQHTQAYSKYLQGLDPVLS